MITLLSVGERVAAENWPRNNLARPMPNLAANFFSPSLVTTAVAKSGWQVCSQGRPIPQRLSGRLRGYWRELLHELCKVRFMQRKIPLLVPLAETLEQLQLRYPHRTTRRRAQAEADPPQANGKSPTASHTWTNLDLLTVAQVSEICGVHPKTVRNWISDKHLRAMRRGRLIRVRRTALKQFLRDNED